ncbi:MAG TPA: hypothetical protein VM899_15995 [Rubellimicrobium sp.]|nr:hypothetical protein [Rubellimicrobium sp.]
MTLALDGAEKIEGGDLARETARMEIFVPLPAPGGEALDRAAQREDRHAGPARIGGVGGQDAGPGRGAVGDAAAGQDLGRCHMGVGFGPGGDVDAGDGRGVLGRGGPDQ